jgi:DNA-binding MarR family transcriptional regulator
VKQTRTRGAPGGEGSREDALDAALDLLHTAVRRLASEPDRELKRRGLGRVHHRILFAVAHGAGLSVGELRRRLRISRQALHQPVGALLAEGLLARSDDPKNRRIKRLALTAKGAALEARLTGTQRAALARAFGEAGAPGEAGWRKVIAALAAAGEDD